MGHGAYYLSVDDADADNGDISHLVPGRASFVLQIVLDINAVETQVKEEERKESNALNSFFKPDAIILDFFSFQKLGEDNISGTDTKRRGF